ncbi:MAG: signal peptide peptidase SppA [Clostridiales Family XIII bacterium]|jgi:protease-4|nr:signal peptide peptidase SppA [Clostridiales Family XIII bacterium]
MNNPYNYRAAGPMPPMPPAQPAKQSHTALIIVVVVIAVIALAIWGIGSVFSNFAGAFFDLNGSGGAKSYAGPASPYIAKVSVVGQIGPSSNNYYSSDSAYHHAWTVKTIDTIMKDDNNAGLYLYVDTPGGTVYESDDLYLKVMEYKETTGRPVYVYMGSMAASGGYYVSAAADYIYANRNTWTGSIGVTLGTMFDVSGFLEEHGIKTDTITSGRNKAMGSNYNPMTEEQRAIFQGLVDEAYDQFVGIVAAGRGIAESDVRELADGRIYTAQQALDDGLIDGIMPLAEAEESILADFSDGTVIDNAYYDPDTNFLGSLGVNAGGGGLEGLLKRLSERLGESGDVAKALELAERQAEAGGPQPMYLYE